MAVEIDPFSPFFRGIQSLADRDDLAIIDHYIADLREMAVALEGKYARATKHLSSGRHVRFSGGSN
jgi:hypothetical protein